MRSTTLGTAILSVSIVFAFISVLFSNISFAVVSLVFVSCYIFAYRGFADELASTDLQVERKILDEMSYAGEPIGITVDILNRHSTMVRGTFVDMIPEDCTIASGTNTATTSLPTRSILRLSYTMVPAKRGAHTIARMSIDRTDPYGLFSMNQMIEQRSDFNVHTQKSSFDAAQRMAGREHLEFSGVGRNPAVVLRELEFDGIRDYVPGDRARDIHWKLLSKMNKLMTKIYKKEGAVQTMVFVDCSRSMRLKPHKVAKIDHAVDISMQLSSILINSFHPTGVATFDELNIRERLSPGLGRRQFEKVVKVLRSVPGAVDSAEPSQKARAEPAKRAKSPKRQLRQSTSGQGEGFLSALGKLSTSKTRARLGLGLDGGIKELIAISRGREQLFIIVTDLISSREAVLTGARICQTTGNRMLVIDLFNDWYGPSLEGYDAKQIEQTYGDLEESIKVEAGLRGFGASFIRVGPADTAAGIARAIRRGRT